MVDKNQLYFKVNNVYIKKCIAKGDYKQQEFRKGKMVNLPRKKIQGFKKYDKVKYFGKEYFIKGRMSTGFAILMDIDFKKCTFNHLGKGMKTPKMCNLKRIGARKTWIIDTKIV